MMTPADKGLLREILWFCDVDEEGHAYMVASLGQFSGVTVMLPIHGGLDYDDWLVLTDRITRFFLVIHGSHMFPEVSHV